MNPSKKIALLLRFLFLGLVLVFWASDLLASYKVVLKDGRVGIGGCTGAVLGHSLARMRDLLDRSLADEPAVARRD